MIPSPKRAQENITRLAKKSAPQGLLVRGVVLSVHTHDPQGSGNGRPEAPERELSGVYCSVLIYSDYPDLRGQILQGCLVSVARGGMHEEHPWIPTPSTLDLSTGKPVTMKDVTSGASPLDLNGDHVLVGFMDNTFNSPVILRGIPHPRSDGGGPSGGLPDSIRPTAKQGQPDYTMHRGIYWGADNSGSFWINATNGHAGQLKADGFPVTKTERDPLDLQPTGSVYISAATGAVVSIVNGSNILSLAPWGASLDSSSPGFSASLTMCATEKNEVDRRVTLEATTATWRSRFRIGIDGRVEIAAAAPNRLETAVATQPIWLRGSRIHLTDLAWEEAEAAIRGTSYVPAVNGILSAINARLVALEGPAIVAAAAAMDTVTIANITAALLQYTAAAATMSSGEFLSTRVFLDPHVGSPIPADLVKFK